MDELCACIKVDAHVVGRRVVGFNAQIRDSHSGVKVIASPGAVSTVQHVSEVLPAELGPILGEIPVAGGGIVLKTWISIGLLIRDDNRHADRPGYM